MAEVAQQLAKVGKRIIEHLPRALGAPAPPQDPKAPPRLRVGPGCDIPVFPPLVAAGAVAAGLALWGITGCRIGFLPLPGAVCAVTGLATAAAAARLKARCEDALKAAGTEADFAPVRKVADAGPYAHTRNPMYVALAGLPLAAAVGLDCAWLLAATAGVIYYVDQVVIPAEEAFLSKQLGDAYADYCSRVRRWL